MNILFLGDIVGRSGRDAVIQNISALKSQYQINLTIANAENAAAGYGLTPEICESLFGSGVDVITTGNHVWDNRDILKLISSNPRVLRPANFSKGSPGNGYVNLQVGEVECIVINAIGRVFMDLANDPISTLDEILKPYPLGQGKKRVIFIDFHAEATSEKLTIAYYLDGRATALVGTHTHVPTADCRILPKGLGYQTDVGMCGDYDSVLGFKFETVLPKFLKAGPSKRMEVATGKGTLCGVILACDPLSGKTIKITPIQLPHI